jgi:F-box protein 9
MSSDGQGKGLDSELESFRQQWISDLQSRKEPVQAASSSSQGSTSPTAARTAAPAPGKKHHGPPSPTLAKRQAILDEGSDYLQGRAFDEPAPLDQVGHVVSEDAPAPKPEKKLVSALDHFEEAMEKESQGILGESLKLYRRAYRVLYELYRTIICTQLTVSSWITVLTAAIAKSTFQRDQKPHQHPQ